MDALADASAAATAAARKAGREKLRTGEKKPESTGTASKSRVDMATLGGKTAGQAKELRNKIEQYNNLKDKTTEKAQLLNTAIKNMESRLPKSVVKDVRATVKARAEKAEGAAMNAAMEARKKELVKKGTYTQKQINEMEEVGMFKKGGSVKNKKVPVVTVGVGMVDMPKGKKGPMKMAAGGMANGKKHMYLANGGAVKDNLNPGLRALQKTRPDVVAKILKKK